MLVATAGSARNTGSGPEDGGLDPQATFDQSEIRDAERRLEAALEAGDPTTWVFDYTEDAVFDGGGEHAAVGRESLLATARSMRPLRSVYPATPHGGTGRPRCCVDPGVLGQRAGAPTDDGEGAGHARLAQGG